MKAFAITMCAAAWLVAAASLEASDKPSIELSGGLSLLDFNAGTAPTVSTAPVGFVTGVTIRAKDWFAVVGEVGGNYQTVTTPSMSLTARQRDYALLAGPRLTKNATPKMAVFAEVLLGSVHRQVSVTTPTTVIDPATDLNRFAWQPGAGVDINLVPHWAVRFEGAYRLTPVSGLVPPRSELTEPRFSSAIVFRC